MINNISSNNLYNQFLRHMPLNRSANQTTPEQSEKSENKLPTAGIIKPTPLAAVNLKKTAEQSETLTRTVATIAIAGGVIGLFFAKGPSAKFFKHLNTYLQKLDDKIFDYTQRYNSLSTVQKIYLKMNKGLQKTLGSLKMLNNITAIKDSAFRWLCDKLYLKKPMDWATKQFKKITVKSSHKAYQNARNVADNNIALLREYIPKLSNNPKEAKLLETYLNNLEKEILAITNSTSRSARLKEISASTNDVGDKVSKELWEIFTHPNKENLKKLGLYRTEVKAAAGREKLSQALQNAQRSFTYNIDDKQRIMSNARDEIARILNVNDKDSRATLRNISKQIKQYGKLSGKTENNSRKSLVDEIRTNVNTLKEKIQNGKYSTEDMSLLNTQIRDIESILNTTDQKGLIEDVLKLLNLSLKTQNPQEYARAKALTKEIRNAVNKAFEGELKLYDKFAEYSVGSAPTDVLGLLLPVGLAGYTISKGKDKEEKVSATLNAGIPITGAVATTFIATAKMMTNMQGLLIGAAAGLVLNALGAKADSKYKEYNQNRIYTQKAVEAYKKNKFV